MQLAVNWADKSAMFRELARGCRGAQITSEVGMPTEIRIVQRFAKESGALHEVVFCCYSGEHFATYKAILGAACAP